MSSPTVRKIFNIPIPNSLLFLQDLSAAIRYMYTTKLPCKGSTIRKAYVALPLKLNSAPHDLSLDWVQNRNWVSLPTEPPDVAEKQGIIGCKACLIQGAEYCGVFPLLETNPWGLCSL